MESAKQQWHKANLIQAENEGAEYKAGTKETVTLQAETGGAKNYEAGTKKTNHLQAQTEGGEHQAGTEGGKNYRGDVYYHRLCRCFMF